MDVSRLPPELSGASQLLRLRSDAALGERFRAGDEGAFAVLYHRHRATVLAVCMKVLGSRQDAEDAAQDSFAALVVALRADPPKDMRAWLRRVGRNAAIDVARRRRPVEGAEDELPDRAVALYETWGELQSILQGIRELPETQGTALVMRELSGHSYREIASLLETEEAAVRGLIARARVALRDRREASELPCADARKALRGDPDARAHDRKVRRHVRGCGACQAFVCALRDDARPVRGLLPLSGGLAGGGALVGGLGAKGALLGSALTQISAACAVSLCAVGGIVLIAPNEPAPRRAHGSARIESFPRHLRAVRVGVGLSLRSPAAIVGASASGFTMPRSAGHVALRGDPATSRSERRSARFHVSAPPPSTDAGRFSAARGRLTTGAGGEEQAHPPRDRPAHSLTDSSNGNPASSTGGHNPGSTLPLVGASAAGGRTAALGPMAVPRASHPATGHAVVLGAGHPSSLRASYSRNAATPTAKVFRVPTRQSGRPSTS